ncbi:MAG: TlpA disulfide reductase family protein [Bacteroidota bacterium]
MLKQTLSTLVCACILSLSASGQNADIKKSIVIKNTPKATITFNLQKMPGIGPAGNSSHVIANFDQVRPHDDFKAYPKVKNKPTGLRNIVEYYYTYNNFQLVYQSYRAGIYTKDYFIKKAAQQKWNLADTIRLSPKPIKCGISVLAGYNRQNEIVYIVDSNNNGDFSDDVLRNIFLDIHDIDPDLAVPVYMEYAAGKVIKNEKILVLVRADKGDTDIRLKFSFPEFRYARFNYQGQTYFVCTDSHPGYDQRITVMPDVPNFSNVAAGSIKMNQFVRLGDKEFTFSGFSENGSKISFSGDDIKDFSASLIPVTTKSVAKVGTGLSTSLISSQLGFMAPTVKGYNVNTVLADKGLISTANLKGKYVFVDFWASYCVYCIDEFPYLKAAYNKYGRDKFEIIGVLNETDQDVTKNLIDEGKMVWPTILTNVKTTDVSGYKINSYPTSYLINPQGKVVAVNLRGEALMNKLKSLIKL